MEPIREQSETEDGRIKGRNKLDVPARFVHWKGKDVGINVLAAKDNFHDIAEWDELQTEQYIRETLLGRLLNSMTFKIVILIVIIVNAVAVGLETNEDILTKYQKYLVTVEHFIVTIFIIEIGLQWCHSFRLFWKDIWNIFDLLLVCLMLSSPRAFFVGAKRLLRIIRLVRALYFLATIKILRGIMVTTRAVLLSIPTILNIFLLFFIVIVIFSMLGTSIIVEIIPGRFLDFFLALFSVFEAVTLDAWGSVNSEVIGKTSSVAYYALLAFYFTIFLMSIFFIRGLIVATLQTHVAIAMEFIDQEVKKKQMEKEIDKDEQKNLEQEAENSHMPIVSLERILQQEEKIRQNNNELTSLQYLTQEKVENYIFLLTVLHENFAEYNRIRNDLHRLVEVVRTLQSGIPTAQELGEEISHEDAIPFRQVHLDENVRLNILSSPHRLQKRKIYTTKAGDRKNKLHPLLAMEHDSSKIFSSEPSTSQGGKWSF